MLKCPVSIKYNRDQLYEKLRSKRIIVVIRAAIVKVLKVVYLTEFEEMEMYIFETWSKV